MILFVNTNTTPTATAEAHYIQLGKLMEWLILNQCGDSTAHWELMVKQDVPNEFTLYELRFDTHCAGSMSAQVMVERYDGTRNLSVVNYAQTAEDELPDWIAFP